MTDTDLAEPDTFSPRTVLLANGSRAQVLSLIHI